MKIIYLLNTDKITLVDDEDYNMLMQYCKPYIGKNGHVYTSNWRIDNAEQYARITHHGKILTIHQILMPESSLKKQVDHIDLNKLNNQKSNLRYATKSQNIANKLNLREIYKGVYESPRKFKKSKYRAAITVNQQTIHLGYFNSSKEAAIAYNEAAIKYFGAFARLNNIGDN